MGQEEVGRKIPWTGSCYRGLGKNQPDKPLPFRDPGSAKEIKRKKGLRISEAIFSFVGFDDRHKGGGFSGKNTTKKGRVKIPFRGLSNLGG